MCIFSGPVRSVSQTKIFARLEQGVQHLVYSMRFDSEEPVAMILPIPIENEEEPSFINFESCPGFFDALENAFPKPKTRGMDRMSFGVGPLTVEQVGSFEASFIPTMADFARLDPRFRLPGNTEHALKEVYRDYGFVVFQLRPKVKPHPMAFSFPTKEFNLFYPTVHIHDGKLEDQGNFDHVLYAQMPPGLICTSSEWQISAGPMVNYFTLDKVPGNTLRNAPTYKRVLYGRSTNKDTRLDLAASSCRA